MHDRVHHLHFYRPKKNFECPHVDMPSFLTNRSGRWGDNPQVSGTHTHTQTLGESQVRVWLRTKDKGSRQSSSVQVRFHRPSRHIWLPPQRGRVMIALSVHPAIADTSPVETTHLRPQGPFLTILLNDMGTAAHRSLKAGYRRGLY